MEIVEYGIDNEINCILPAVKYYDIKITSSRYGDVCDNGWTDLNSHVACNELYGN